MLLQKKAELKRDKWTHSDFLSPPTFICLAYHNYNHCPLHWHLLRLHVELFFQLSDLGLQGDDGRFILGLHGCFKLLQLLFELLVLAFQLGASPLQPLGVATLCSQLCGQLLSLMSQTSDVERCR